MCAEPTDVLVPAGCNPKSDSYSCFKDMGKVDGSNLENLMLNGTSHARASTHTHSLTPPHHHHHTAHTRKQALAHTLTHSLTRSLTMHPTNADASTYIHYHLSSSPPCAPPPPCPLLSLPYPGGVTEIYCVGLTTDFCVRYTIEDARKYIPGAKIFFVEDACKPTSGCDHQGLGDIRTSFESQQVR